MIRNNLRLLGNDGFEKGGVPQKAKSLQRSVFSPRVESVKNSYFSFPRRQPIEEFALLQKLTKYSAYDSVNNSLAKVESKIESRNAQNQEVVRFIKSFRKLEGLLTKIDNYLWLVIVHQILIKMEEV
jgi:hypothetical protein